MSTTEYKPGIAIEDLPPEVQQKHPIKLASNENPWGPSPQALAKIQEEAASLNLYPGKAMETTLAEAIVAAWDRRITSQNLILGNGGSDILEMAARIYLADPDAECVLPSSTFPLLARYCSSQNRRIAFYNLDSENFSYSASAILAQVTSKTRLVYICNPNNPTGTYVPAPLLEELLEKLPENVLLINDEAYYHFVDALDYPDSVGHVLAGKPMLIVHTFSKVFGLAGLRLGYGIAPPAIVERISELRRAFHIPRLALVGGTAALADIAHVHQSVERNGNGRSWVSEQLQALGCRVWPSQANFVLYSHPVVPASAIFEQLLLAGVIVRPGFGLNNHIRVSIGTPEENERFIESMRVILTAV